MPGPVNLFNIYLLYEKSLLRGSFHPLTHGKVGRSSWNPGLPLLLAHDVQEQLAGRQLAQQLSVVVREDGI